MSYTHSNIFIPTARLVTPARRLGRTCSLSQVSTLHVSVLCKMPRLVCSSLKNKTHGPICLFGGKGSSRGQDKVQAFPWDPLKDFVRSWSQERSIQDTLREQMRQQEFGGEDGGGNRAGYGGDGSGDAEDEGFGGILDETLQVILATIGFIFVYIYIIRGAELSRLARDYIKYLFGGVPSMRLKRAMDRWRRFFDKFSWTEDSEDWLVRRILTTPTWWHRPKALARVIRKKLRDYERK